MIYEILDTDGKVINTIMADLAFMQVNYPDGNYRTIPEPAPSPESIKAEIVDKTQQRLDDFARTRNYDGILSACTYATSTVPKFQTEGQYCVDSRDATWAKLYEILAEVEAGTRPAPTGYADVEPELPALEWPNEAPNS